MLRFHDVSVHLNDRVLVDTVSLEAGPGEIVGLVGPNGSGKSTLLRTAYRALRPTGGTVTLCGYDVWSTSVRVIGRAAGVVIQQMPADFPLAVREVVLLGRSAHKGLLSSDNACDRRIVNRELDSVGMADRSDDDFGRLSGGERQRTLIAQALAGEPRVLLFDEPTNHLDLRHQSALMRMVAERRDTAVIALHDLGLAARFCDKIAVMHGGGLYDIGAPDEVITEAMLDEVYGVQARILQHPTDSSPVVVVL